MAWTNSSKNSATFSNSSKSSAPTFTNLSKNSTTFKNYFRHGKDISMADLANFTFTDVIFPDGKQLQNITFDELVEQVWTNLTKHSATFSNATKH